MYLLDTTLRDGGNINDWSFAREDIKTIVRLLDSAGMDLIEVGYRGGSGSKKPAVPGLALDCPNDLLVELVPQRAKLCVMVVPSVCTIEQTVSLADTPTSMIRVASYPNDVALALPMIRHLKRSGFVVSFNLMAATYVPSPTQLSELIEPAVAEGADLIYLADSFGAMNPRGVQEVVGHLKTRFPIDVGFHGHNNLGLAFANALAAMSAGARYVDSSLCGMARGAGNLATEFCLAAMAGWLNDGRSVSLSAVLDAAEFVDKKYLHKPMPTGRREIECGVGDVHYYWYDRIDAASSAAGVDRLRLMTKIGRRRALSIDAAALHTAITECQGESP